MPKSLQILYSVSLANLTTFGIGGDAKYLVKVETDDDGAEALEYSKLKQLDVFVLGGGSNVLVSDTGFDGVVLQMAIEGIEERVAENGDVEITAGAGTDWDRFVSHCVNHNLAGIECLSGIPGLVGGTPIQNVGAYGQEASETISRVRVLDRTSLKIYEIPNEDCGFEYRSSIFNSLQNGRFVVLAVSFLLTRDGKPKIVYRDLVDAFTGCDPTLKDARKAVCDIRRNKGMLVRQGGHDAQSAGSFFKNPIIADSHLQHIKQRRPEFTEIPFYPMDKGFVKIPAAWLIENVGFDKGFKLGNAGLSTKHTLALTNRGGAMACEILKLKSKIEEEVKKSFDIDLTVEPTLVGF